MGLRSLEDGYTPEILDVSKLDRRLLVSNAEALVGLRALLDREGIWAGVSAGAVVEVARRVAASMEPDQNVVCLLADGGWKYASAGLWSRDAGRARGRHGEPSLVVADAPLQLPRGDRRGDRRACPGRAARRGVRDRVRRRRHGDPVPSGLNADASPFRYSIDAADLLRIVTDIDDAEEDLLAIYHSHTRSPAFPSRTDVELAFWPDAAYLIVSLASDPPDLKAFTIRDGRIAKRELGLT